MRFILVILLLFSSQLLIAQANMEFKSLNLGSHKEEMNFVTQEIALEKTWNERKIRMVCLKTTLLNRVGSYLESEELLKTIPIDKVISNNCQGIYYLSNAVVGKYLGFTEKSYKEFKKAHNYSRNNKRYCELANEYVEEAEFHRKNSQFDLAVNCIDSALYYYNKYQCDPSVKVKLLNRHAAIANEYSSANESCIDLSIKSINLSKKIGEKYWLAVSYHELASAYNEKNQVDSAQFYSSLAEKEFRKLDLLQDAMHAKLGIAFHARDYGKSIEVLEEIVKETTEKKINYSLLIVYARLKDLYNITSQYQKAIESYDKFNEAWIASVRKEQAAELAKIQDDFKSKKLLVENEKIKLENQRDQEALKKQKLIVFTVVIFTVFLVVFIVILLLNSRIKRKLNKELKLKNKQKDVLIQEVHHRVKNNLQYVQSILFFQSTKTDVDNKTLNDISRRIDAISLVHEMLYSINDSEDISVRDYLEKLIRCSEQLYNNDLSVDFQLDIEDFNLPMKSMEAIGVICSELINNAVKHAFENTKSPIFSIQFKKGENNFYTLKTFDNGKSTKKPASVDGLGVQMIDIYSRQLKGNYSLNREDGYQYQVIFNIRS